VFYTPNGTTVSSKGVPDHWILEYLSGLATAGTYGSAPTKQQLFGPGIKKPGDVVQTVVATTSSVHGGTTSTSDVALGTSTINPLRILASGHWQTAASSTDALASLKIKRGGSTKVGPLSRQLRLPSQLSEQKIPTQ
jgi:hypothetical protein